MSVGVLASEVEGGPGKGSLVGAETGPPPNPATYLPVNSLVKGSDPMATVLTLAGSVAAGVVVGVGIIYVVLMYGGDTVLSW